jgi:hypothetical protein
MRVLNFKVCATTPFTIISNLEKVIGWMSFGYYKPCIGATLCGLLEEWKESKDARDYEGTRSKSSLPPS